MIGERIRQARLVSGLTQQEVVDQLAQVGASLTKAGLSKYERGGSTPDADLVIKLAKVLGVRPHYFLHEPGVEIVWMAYRSHRRLPDRRRGRIQALARKTVEPQVWLQEKLFPDAGAQIPKAVRPTGLDDAESLAANLRNSWGLGTKPIESVTETLEDRGGIVVECPEQGAAFDGLCGRVNDSYPVVVVNSTMPDDRRRFSMAHELGHLLMDGQDLTPKVEESCAHRFAGAFLVPADAARRELGPRRRRLDVEELKLLKIKHGMSMLAWVHRAHDLDIISQGHFQSLCKLFGARGWRKEEPVAYHGREKPIRLTQMVLRALAEGILTPEKAEECCPGLTREAEKEEAPVHVSAVELMKLPKRDRERILSQAAILAASDYRDKRQLTGFEAFGDEDMIDDAS